MGLRCSLLGHDYGETTTEREREEQGGEVVVVERDLEICSRCGAEKVLSENTEVRTTRASPEQDEPDTGAPEPEATDSSFSEPASASAPSAIESEEPGAGTPVEHAPAADEDDGVILDDEPGEERDPGQWPDEAQQEAMTETADAQDTEPTTPWPDQAGEDEGFDAKPASETDDEGGDVDFGGGLTPDSADSELPGDEGYVEAPSEPESEYTNRPSSGTPTDQPSGQPATQSSGSSGGGASSGSRSDASGGASADSTVDDSVADAGFTSAGPVNPPSGSTDDGDSLLVCPECGFERTAARASLRAGDICPECRKGYLAERR